MFEKSLYDLIRGLRHHRGNEKDYIQKSLRECRAEVRSPDMDLKATALLKLMYLEMFGHDMSWASFHVLEVMSSSKFHQKRLGYLGAVQSFRADTEILMLATNLLKKDVMSASMPVIGLPLVTLPHIMTSSLASPLMTDVMPRLTHSSPEIRKKAVVTAYRLALVYPEGLRLAWPKIKDMLLDPDEDPSVTAALVNVICELGCWRPKDLLPFAPRLFDLLIDGGNNWMAIKLVKLFACLTPLEPRLAKKLLPRLTELIQTTPAMSLLYECVNGIIRGRFLDGTEGSEEGDQIAQLCIDKLSAMITLDGDPNLKYVALLAFKRVVTSHPHLLEMHQDVILRCLEDQDISIRMQALGLCSRIVDTTNLMKIVEILYKQLQNANSTDKAAPNMTSERTISSQPTADYDDEDPGTSLRHQHSDSDGRVELPLKYRVAVTFKILSICSRDSFANVTDFEWYIDILSKLARVCPADATDNLSNLTSRSTQINPSVAKAIGHELRNVAVRVATVRSKAVEAADAMLTEQSFLTSAHSPILQYASWILGEYAHLLNHPRDTLHAILLLPMSSLGPDVLCAILQAVPKIFISIFARDRSWNMQQASMTELLLARILHNLKPLTTSPDLEVQERAVELTELMRLAADSINPADSEMESCPLVLSQLIPSLFQGAELKPVAAGAQRKVPCPDGLNLDMAINEKLASLLQDADLGQPDRKVDEAKHFYYVREEEFDEIEMPQERKAQVAGGDESATYHGLEADKINPQAHARRAADRLEKYRDDPFYIALGQDRVSGNPSTPGMDDPGLHDVNVDTIPILDLSSMQSTLQTKPAPEATKQSPAPKARALVAAEEGLEDPATAGATPGSASGISMPTSHDRSRRGILGVDASGIRGLSLDDASNDFGTSAGPSSIPASEDKEMAQALAEVERLRLEMQRASERVQLAHDVPPDGVLVKKKKKKKKVAEAVDEAGPEAEAVTVKKKPKKKKKPPAPVEEAPTPS